MTKFTKYILVLSALIAILLAIPFFISIDSYKTIIAEKVKEHTGRDFKMDGEITFAILPMPQIKISDVKLSSLPGAKATNLVEIEMVKAKLLLPPLLSGKIVIANLELINPIINLEKLGNGKNTWDIRRDKNDNARAEEKPSESLVTISDIKIKSGKLQYLDRGNVTTINNLDLDVTIPHNGKPKFDLNLSLAAINLNTSASSSSKAVRWPKDKIDLSALASANGTIHLTIPKVISGSLMIDNISVKAKLSDGNLNVSSFNAGLYGGSIEAKGSVSANGNHPLVLNFTLKNAKLTNIAPSGSKIKVTDGLVDLACDLQSTGGSQFEYVNNLNGNFSLNGKNGKVSGIDLQKITQALNKPRDITALGQNIESALGKGDTIFSNLNMNGAITKGMMKINECELISNETSINTTGQMNLPQFSLEALAIVNSGIKNIPPLQIRLYGSLDNPQHKIDVKAIWQYLAKNALTGVIDNIKQGKTNPKDILNGLLGSDGSQPNETGPDESSSQNPNKAAQKLMQKGLKELFN